MAVEFFTFAVKAVTAYDTAAAAEVTCWEATELPPALAGLLKEHATGHIASQTM